MSRKNVEEDWQGRMSRKNGIEQVKARRASGTYISHERGSEVYSLSVVISVLHVDVQINLQIPRFFGVGEKRLIGDRSHHPSELGCNPHRLVDLVVSGRPGVGTSGYTARAPQNGRGGRARRSLCERGRERVCERWSERDRESVCVRERVRERERVCVNEREKECMCVRESVCRMTA
jgi:hypothetical protein